MTEGLYLIDHKAKGLRGFVGNLGRKLESELVDKFNGRIERHKIGVKYDESSSSDFFELAWSYRGAQYNFSGGFFLNKSFNSFELVIDRSPGVKVYSNFNWASPSADPTELRIAADMEEAVKGFLDEEFGESTSTRGNGCPIYRTVLPEAFRLEAA